MGLTSVVTRVDDAATAAYAKALVLRLVGYLAQHDWWIIPPQKANKSPPVNPTPMFLAIFQKAGMTFEWGIKDKWDEGFSDNLCVIG
eukprot:gene3154-21410_t